MWRDLRLWWAKRRLKSALKQVEKWRAKVGALLRKDSK